MRPHHDPAPSGAISRQIQRLPVTALRRHPAYRDLFGPPPRGVVAGLATGLADNPATPTPVEVLPGGAVLFAPEYVMAAKQAGVAELEVVVLTGLAGAGEAAVEAYVIDAGLRRGRHGRMAQLRCLRRAREIRREVPPALRQAYYHGDLVTSAMRIWGKDRRTVLHYTQVLEAPVEVQDALDAGEISLVTAKAVAKLPPAAQDEIAQAIRGGGRPAAVVGRHVAPPPKRHKNVRKARDAAVKGLEGFLADLEDRPGQVTCLFEDQAAILRRSEALCHVILGGARVVSREEQQAHREALRRRLQGQTGEHGGARPEAGPGADEPAA
jgi:hypothetical protein